MINDVSKAYFYAKATRDLYIELPFEDPMHGQGLIGKVTTIIKRFERYGQMDVKTSCGRRKYVDLTKQEKPPKE